jgi:hypothetical protein
MAAAGRRPAAGTVEAMTTPRTLLLGLTGALYVAALLLLSTGCGDSSSAASTASDAGASPKVLFLGDSVAAGEALPLAAAIKASGAGFASIAADGGGNVVGPFSDKNWAKLPGQIAAARPDLVVYQLTTYDWGSRQRQRAAYERLLRTVDHAGARLVFVTMPPIRPDDFYRPHMADLRRTTDVARTVAAASHGRAALLDAEPVWGTSYRQTRDGKADRSADGIHACPQGAARFTSWLLWRLSALAPGLNPAPAPSWANAGWSGDRHFQGC